MIEKLTNIVLNNELKINRTKYYQYVSLKKSINLENLQIAECCFLHLWNTYLSFFPKTEKCT